MCRGPIGKTEILSPDACVSVLVKSATVRGRKQAHGCHHRAMQEKAQVILFCGFAPPLARESRTATEIVA